MICVVSGSHTSLRRTELRRRVRRHLIELGPGSAVRRSAVRRALPEAGARRTIGISPGKTRACAVTARTKEVRSHARGDVDVADVIGRIVGVHGRNLFDDLTWVRP